MAEQGEGDSLDFIVGGFKREYDFGNPPVNFLFYLVFEVKKFVFFINFFFDSQSREEKSSGKENSNKISRSCTGHP